MQVELGVPNVTVLSATSGRLLLMANVNARSWSTVEWLEATPSIAIPVYQREYRWSPGTCDKLLDDIRAVAERPAGDTHFIGSVLAKPDADGRLTMVDGQQRITSIQLILAAIADLAVGEVDGPTREIRSLLAAPDDAADTRLKPHERFSHELTQLLLAGQEGAEDSQFRQNYRFMLDRIGDDWPTVWAGMRRLEHVTIELGERSNAQQIFESLNSTGASLSDDELIHNYVHMGRDHAAQVELERETWVPIEEATAGYTREFWRDYLILTSELVQDFSGDFGVFRAFKTRFSDPTVDITAEQRSHWLEIARLYEVLLNPSLEQDPIVERQLHLLQAFGGAPRPLMMAVYGDYRAGRISPATVVETLEQLQTMLIRRALVGHSTDIAKIGRLCNELRESGYPISGLLGFAPEDPATRLALTHGSLPLAGYVLRRLQFGDRTDLDLQIEHVYPQTPHDVWSSDGLSTWGDLANEDQARYRTLLNTIGNLTLLESGLNQGAGNRAFLRKAEYYRRSEVAETRGFADLQRWDSAAIENRTQVLTEAFLRRWPRPSGTPMRDVDDLIKVVDLSRPALHGYPAVFEYAEFDGAIWGDVETSKQLLVRLVDEVCRIDLDRLMASEHGRLVQVTREPRRSYERLANGKLLYVGWAHQYLLEVCQQLLEEFGLEDALRVKVVAANEPGVGAAPGTVHPS